MNAKFNRMKAGSERLNRMTQDIRWCVTTVLGMVNGVCKNKVIPIFSMRKEVGIHPKDFDQYFVEVGMDATSKISITFIVEDSPDRDIERNPFEQWDSEEIKLVYDNLDAVIEAAHEFCQKVKPEFGGIAFHNSMQRLTYVIE